MPTMGDVKQTMGKNADYYEIIVKQFQQQILPSTGYGAMGTDPFPLTTVWSYASAGNIAGTLNYPAFTIEAKVDTPVRVKWINGLVDNNGNYLPHILPVDPTLHWANPPGGIAGRDKRPTFTSTPGPYTGPVPLVTHVHGAHVADDSDGYTEAWYLPAANDIPMGYATEGTWYNHFMNQFAAKTGVSWGPGFSIFQYSNDQRATTLWYHDHSLGMTRLNVYAGPAGFYLIRGGKDDLSGNQVPGPAPSLGDKPGTKYYEIPIVVQDRSFKSDGSLFFPDNRAYFEGLNQFPDEPYLNIPFIGEDGCTGPSDVSPIANPEFFGNTMVANGKTWPNLDVEPRRYRFRFLNGCNSRFIILRITSDPTTRPAASALPFWQIGAEGGFLPASVQLDTLLIGLAERADVIVDFTGLTPGTQLYMINEGPDEPFNGGPFVPADPFTTGQVMQFTVVPLASKDNSKPPARLKLPKITPLGPSSVTRQVSLNEEESKTVFISVDMNGNVVLDCMNGEPFGPTAALLGLVDLTDPMNPSGIPLLWMDDITENPAVNATETWEIYNFTMDAHPIHLHLVEFEVVNREIFSMESPRFDAGLAPIGTIFGAEAWETGRKDTVIAYPGEITRLTATFDMPGLYVWHCHIVDHEDNEMMRPYAVGLILTP